MLKVITCINRKPGLSVEEFQNHWRGQHAEIVTRMPNIRRYVQSHCLPGGYRKRDLIYDGIAEVWSDDLDSLREMTSGDAYKVVQKDEENFIDKANMAVIIVDDHLIKDGAVDDQSYKNIEFVRRRPDLSVSDFQDHWRNIHGPLAAKIPVLKRYVQSHARLGGYRNGKQPPWDGCAITWFDSIEDMRHSATTPEFADTMADEPNFIQHETDGTVATIITKEFVIVD